MTRQMDDIVNSAPVLDRHSAFPVESIRAFFPALHRDPSFIFFDNAAGAQVPVTGGNSGIGLASARPFIELSLKLWLVGQHQTNVEEMHGSAGCSKF